MPDLLRSPLPALRFEPDAFSLGRDKIMGRQSAGEGFLRAAVEAADGGALMGAGPNVAAARGFAAAVAAIDPRVSSQWISTADLRGLTFAGGLHLPDPSIGRYSRLRARVGAGAFFLTGVTHTISSGWEGAMGLLADMSAAPLTDWDALICTSEAVRASVTTLLDAQDAYAIWRYAGRKPPRPQLPVIPLGVHSEAFAQAPGAAAHARAELGLADDEIAFLFLGRLSFHAKAHPFPMYVGLEAAARATGKKIVLIECGWFANEYIEKAFRDGAARFAPSVRHVVLDGRDAAARARAWGACDVFISLSDNIQETFGLTIVEAMAAGKPVIATDWDGYRQTLRHGETGFLIPTFMPPAGLGEHYALDHAEHEITYDLYIGAASGHVSLDLGALRAAIVALARDPDLRRRMGAAGRATARERFDWRVVMQDYLALWRDLDARRRAALDGPLARARLPVASQLDPFTFFSAYPTHVVTGRTRVAPFAAAGDWRAVADHVLFDVTRRYRSRPELCDAILARLAQGEATIDELAAATQTPAADVIHAATLMAKWGAVRFRP